MRAADDFATESTSGVNPPLIMLAWHLATKDQDYAFARPGLVNHKRRKLELAAGAPSRRGNHRRPGGAYNDKQRRAEETALVEQAEHA